MVCPMHFQPCLVSHFPAKDRLGDGEIQMCTFTLVKPPDLILVSYFSPTNAVCLSGVRHSWLGEGRGHGGGPHGVPTHHPLTMRKQSLSTFTLVAAVTDPMKDGWRNLL
jgi:hypothetical protein